MTNKELWAKAVELVGEQELSRRFRVWCNNLIKKELIKRAESSPDEFFLQQATAILDDLNRRAGRHPEIQFIFLTKGGYQVYRELNDGDIYPENVILGITVTRPEDLPLQGIGRYWPGWKRLINIEPMLSTFTRGYAWDRIKEYDWIILGAETGNRKEKVIPKLEWYMYLLNQTIIPVFMKPSLDKYTPKELIRREYIS